MCSCVRSIFRIDARADAPVKARRIVSGELGSVLPRERLEDLELIISELVTNGIKYGANQQNDTIVLDLRVDSGVRCAVIDHGSGFPAEASWRNDAPLGGRWGLKVVDQLARRWGVTRADDCTEVWAEAAVCR